MNRHAAFLKMLKPGSNDWALRSVSSGCLSTVQNSDAIEMMNAYISNEISYEELLDWTNLVLFNDSFTFDSNELRDCLDHIEESDEPGNSLSVKDIQDMIDTLQ